MRIPRVPDFLRRPPRLGSGDFTWDLDQYSPGNKLTLFVRGGPLYEAMLAAVEEARETIHVETYIFRADRIGTIFLERLERKARAGVRVRFIYDSVGCLDLPPEAETRLRNAGVEVLEYHPVAPWRPRWAWNQRDHRKVMICDGRVGFIGGMNICDDHAAPEDGGSDWRDAHARVVGPAAYDLDRLFRATWFKHTGRWFESHGDPETPRGPSRVRIVGNSELLNRFVIREAYANALRAARSEVSVANSYFVPDWRIRRSLAQAVRRGVLVRVLVPGISDVPPVWYAMRAAYDSLISRGIRVFEWPGPMMHAKAAVVDRRWCAVGSYNLDHRSLVHNLEANLHTVDTDFAAQLADAFERGVESAREITLPEWRRRPFGERLLESFWSSFDTFF